MNVIQKIGNWIQNTLLSVKTLNLILSPFRWLSNLLRPRERFRQTKTHALLMQMPPLKRRMIVMLFSVFVLLGLIVGFNQLKTFMFNRFMAGMGIQPATVTTMVVEKQEWQPKVMCARSAELT
jgi:membrane fusion protein (multidrug efflux system)